MNSTLTQKYLNKVLKVMADNKGSFDEKTALQTLDKIIDAANTKSAIDFRRYRTLSIWGIHPGVCGALTLAGELVKYSRLLYTSIADPASLKRKRRIVKIVYVPVIEKKEDDFIPIDNVSNS